MSHSPSVMNSLKTAALMVRNPGAVSSTCVVKTRGPIVVSMFAPITRLSPLPSS